MQKREVIPPGALGVVPVKFDLNLSAGGKPAGATRLKNETLTENQKRRLELAQWIADPANPLTARVIVNRIWQYHFCDGLVNTPSDFGANGERPMNPALLDWLAAEVMQPC